MAGGGGSVLYDRRQRVRDQRIHALRHVLGGVLRCLPPVVLYQWISRHRRVHRHRTDHRTIHIGKVNGIILCLIESVDTLVSFVMKISKNSR